MKTIQNPVEQFSFRFNGDVFDLPQGASKWSDDAAAFLVNSYGVRGIAIVTHDPEAAPLPAAAPDAIVESVDATNEVQAAGLPPDPSSNPAYDDSVSNALVDSPQPQD